VNKIKLINFKCKNRKIYIFGTKYIVMRGSNFWFYTIMVIVILHFVVGFAYLIFKLSPKKGDKKNKGKNG
jgi:hypothetical protein